MKVTSELPHYSDLVLPPAPQFAILPDLVVDFAPADAAAGVEVGIRRDAFSPLRPRAPDSARAPPVLV